MKALSLYFILILAISCSQTTEQVPSVALEKIYFTVDSACMALQQNPHNYQALNSQIIDTITPYKKGVYDYIEMNVSHTYQTSVAEITGDWLVFAYPKTGEIKVQFNGFTNKKILN